MPRDLLRPKALFGHVLVAAVVITCVALGQWQFDRLAQVREHNAILDERFSAPPLDLDRSLAQGLGSLDVEELAFRRVRVSGRYEPDAEVLQRNQEGPGGQSGFHVLTPLRARYDLAVLVVRGWVPPDRDTPPVRDAPPPTGVVTVSGVLVPSVDQPSWGARDPEEGTLERVFHADTERLARQIDGEVFDLVLRADTGAGDRELPVPVGSPELDEGNHLSYAIQWHIFAVIAAASYGALLWSRHRRGHSGGDEVARERVAHPSPSA